MPEPLQVYFASSQTNEAEYSWTRLAQNSEAQGDLVRSLAYRIVGFRCPPHYKEAWAEAVENGSKLFGKTRTGFQAMIGSVLGLPDQNSGEGPSLDHIHGFVAEALWNFLSEDYTHRNPVERIEWGWDPTDPGGDGLIVHRNAEGHLSFRIWEIKKASGAHRIGPNVSQASQQLRDRAPSYLARWMKVGQEHLQGDLAVFYHYLVDHWYDAAPQASAGVALAASDGPVPDPCFHQLPEKLGEFRTPNRLRGLLMIVGDLPEFCQRIQEEIWTAL